MYAILQGVWGGGSYTVPIKFHHVAKDVHTVLRRSPVVKRLRM